MADRPDPAQVLVGQADATVQAFTVAMAPVVRAYLGAAAQAGEALTAWARQMSAALGEMAVALESSHGQREGRGDPTGDPPLGRGDGG
jgi:hypothetical protein